MRRITLIAIALFLLLNSSASAQRCPLDLSRPACGKVCKLVCETKKITAIGYGNECKLISLPPPSQPGCKHCSCCCGEVKCEPGQCCQPAAPKFEFCWRNWLVCGCACPRTVKVLTKWQVEKKIPWYHWEVIDAAKCDCAGNFQATGTNKLKIVQSPASQDIYKPAPDEAEVGSSLPVTTAELAELSAAFGVGAEAEPQEPARLPTSFDPSASAANEPPTTRAPASEKTTLRLVGGTLPE
jgi:hypothetical protein